MRFVIFGTGNMYQKYKSEFRKDVEIVAFIDNQADKWGKKIDGITVYSPEQLLKFKFDGVFLLSTFCLEMRMQLKKMGIPNDKIYLMDNHIEALCEIEPALYYGMKKEKLPWKEKRILVFSHSLKSTGAQNVLYYAVCCLQKRNYQIIVISREDGVIREKLGKQGIPSIIIRDIYSKKDEVERLVDWADVIFVNTLLLYDTVIGLSDYNKRLVWWIHETGILRLIEDDFKYIEMKKMVSIFAVSPMVKRIIRLEYGGNLKIGELKCGLPQYEIKKRHEKNKSKLIFAVIGAMGYIKGQDVFLNAISKLPDMIREKAVFWLIGGGELQEGEKKIAEKYSCIKILGEIDNSKMRNVYANIDVVVCSSRIEALSVAVIEGCMNGKMPIVSDAAGIADFIEHKETGIIFESENVDELAKWIRWAIENLESTRQIGNAAKKIYSNNFSMDLFEQNLLKVITK